jgi:hypothetical protein
MNKGIIGVLYTGKSLGKDEKFFLKISKKKNIDLIMINVSENIDLDFLKNTIKKCDVIYNSSAEEFALEYARTIEEWGKKLLIRLKFIIIQRINGYFLQNVKSTIFLFQKLFCCVKI